MTGGQTRDRKVAVVGCKHTTRDYIALLSAAGVRIDHCVTIDPAKAQEQKVAGFYDLRSFLESLGIPYTVARKYALTDEDDRAEILGLGIDVALVMGWQRLIPEWWLQALSVGAFGMHGSFKPLPHGRGRSPMNWALLQGRTLFFTHLFRYAPGVDDGDVVGSQVFDLTPFDDAHTAHLKNLTAAVRLVARHLPALLAGTATLEPQPPEPASYWPKRSAEDGLIHWSDTTLDIHNLIRAVTRPFPGAFCFVDDDESQKLVIWRAVPFDSHLLWPNARPGEIVAVFYDGSFIVRTGDTALLVQESEGPALTANDIGRSLGVAGRERKRWTDLPG